MRSSGKHPLDYKVEVDELYIDGPEKDKRGRNKEVDKNQVVIAVEKMKGEKIKRAYAECRSDKTIQHIMLYTFF
jgi:hypothetical protein